MDLVLTKKMLPECLAEQLETLTITSCRQNDSAIDVIIEWAVAFQKLTTLNIDYNNFSNEALVKLGEVLPNTNLRELSFNELGSDRSEFKRQFAERFQVEGRNIKF